MDKRNIEINGDLLAAHREKSGLTRAGLSQRLLPARISEETIKRAERGNINPKKLEIISRFFKVNPNIFRSKISIEIDLSGDWTTIYLEKEPGHDKYISVENLSVTQLNNTITGIYSPDSSEHPNLYIGTSIFQMSGQIIKDFIFGNYSPDITNPKYPQGTGVFQMKIIKNQNWIEGFCTYFSDDDNIAVSSTIWVRKSWDEHDFMIISAKNLLRTNGVFHTSPTAI